MKYLRSIDDDKSMKRSNSLESQSIPRIVRFESHASFELVESYRLEKFDPIHLNYGILTPSSKSLIYASMVEDKSVTNHRDSTSCHTLEEFNDPDYKP